MIDKFGRNVSYIEHLLNNVADELNSTIEEKNLLIVVLKRWCSLVFNILSIRMGMAANMRTNKMKDACICQ